MAMLYFEQLGGRVLVHIASDVPINAWQGSVLLPFGIKNVQVNTTRSISDVWQEAPMFHAEEISFTGGKLNGFVGDGILFEFSVNPGTYSLRFSPQTAVYLNNGLGTKSQLALRTLDFSLSSDLASPLAEDMTPPESFTPTIYRQKDFFNGNPVAIFSTHDLQSGVSSYEIRETVYGGIIDWHIGRSPYVINSDVRMLEIKAIDYAGNERIETLHTRGYFLMELSTIVTIIFVAGIMYTIGKWWKSRKERL